MILTPSLSLSPSLKYNLSLSPSFSLSSADKKFVKIFIRSLANYALTLPGRATIGLGRFFLNSTAPSVTGICKKICILYYTFQLLLQKHFLSLCQLSLSFTSLLGLLS